MSELLLKVEDVPLLPRSGSPRPVLRLSLPLGTGMPLGNGGPKTLAASQVEKLLGLRPEKVQQGLRSR